MNRCIGLYLMIQITELAVGKLSQKCVWYKEKGLSGVSGSGQLGRQAFPGTSDFSQIYLWCWDLVLQITVVSESQTEKSARRVEEKPGGAC